MQRTDFQNSRSGKHTQPMSRLLGTRLRFRISPENMSFEFVDRRPRMGFRRRPGYTRIR